MQRTCFILKTRQVIHVLTVIIICLLRFITTQIPRKNNLRCNKSTAMPRRKPHFFAIAVARIAKIVNCYNFRLRKKRHMFSLEKYENTDLGRQTFDGRSNALLRSRSKTNSFRRNSQQRVVISFKHKIILKHYSVNHGIRFVNTKNITCNC